MTMLTTEMIMITTLHDDNDDDCDVVYNDDRDGGDLTDVCDY